MTLYLRWLIRLVFISLNFFLKFFLLLWAIHTNDTFFSDIFNLILFYYPDFYAFWIFIIFEKAHIILYYTLKLIILVFFWRISYFIYFLYFWNFIGILCKIKSVKHIKIQIKLIFIKLRINFFYKIRQGYFFLFNLKKNFFLVFHIFKSYFVNFYLIFIFKLKKFYKNKNSSFIFNFYKYLFFLVKSFFRKFFWYPIFKRHSIFGYYRLSRQNWVELKPEEIHYIKY